MISGADIIATVIVDKTITPIVVVYCYFNNQSDSA